MDYTAFFLSSVIIILAALYVYRNNLKMAEQEQTVLQMKEQMEITENKIQTSKRCYGFHVQLTNHVSLGSSQTVIFDKVITNIGDAYNFHTGTFTAKTDGLYYFSATFLQIGSNGLHLQMVRNTEELSRGHTPAVGGNAGSINAFTILKKNDVVYVRHYPGKGEEMIHGLWSFFTGYLVSYPG